MVLIGRTKFGQNNRISLVEGLPDILNLEIGDYVEFHVIDGKLILRKETKLYNGIDFEGQEIEENLRKLEESKSDAYDMVDEIEDSIERGRLMYLRDKEEREKKKKMNGARRHQFHQKICWELISDWTRYKSIKLFLAQYQFYLYRFPRIPKEMFGGSSGQHLSRS